METPFCRRCETLPDAPSGSSVLHLALPLAHTLASLRAVLAAEGIAFQETGGEILSVPVEPDALARVAALLRKSLSALELRDTRCVLLPPDVPLTLSQLGQVRPLRSMLAELDAGWLTTILREKRLTTYFQPIVSSREPAKIHAHECLLRARETDGTLIPPSRLFETAREADLLTQLDQAARFTHIRSAAELGVEKVFINFNPSVVYDPQHCLRTTVAAVEEAGIAPDRVVFEVVESDHSGDPEHLLSILRFYHRGGFRMALDDLGAGFSSLNLLTRLRPDYIKLDAGLIRGVDEDPYKAQIAGKVLELARDLGVTAIVEGVETPGEWHWARDQGADYCQGFLFARPANPPTVPVVPA